MPDFNVKMHQNRFRLVLCPRPPGGAYSAPPDSLAGFKGPTSKGREWEGKGGKGKGEEGRGMEGRGGKRRGGEENEGKGETLRNFSFYNLTTGSIVVLCDTFRLA